MPLAVSYCLLPIACMDTEGHGDTEGHRGTANTGCKY
jgi:hypothetical protein